MNVFVGIGRLTADPELRYTNSNKAVCNYTLAIDKGNGDGADFLRCVCWEKTAEVAAKYLRKGTKIAVTGSVQTSKYEDKDGKSVNKTEILVRSHDFCEKASQLNQPAQPQTYIPQQNTQPAPMPASLSDFEEVISDGVLPF